MLLEMGGVVGDSARADALHPAEYRAFDREGRLVEWIVFGKNAADTISVTRRSYDARGLCVRTEEGRPVMGRRWKWARTEFAYDTANALLWRAEFGDSLDLVPHTVFCYSSNIDEEQECIGRWKSVRTLKIVYQNERQVPVGEQWVLGGTSYGAIRYEADTVPSRDHTFVRYRLPTENVGGETHTYVANYYDETGRLVEQWGYRRESLIEGAYSYADLSEIRRFDSLGRTVFHLSVGDDTASSMYRTAFTFDERGNLVERTRLTYASFGAFMRGEVSEERLQDRFRYGDFDKYGNWRSAVTEGESGHTRGHFRRTFEYY